ncbi:MAG: lantibiotic dehydratase C-terminal domain-containing protein [Patescibacteria group bacterium]|jgi:thiopeptide-type bacteriocin biosynthesis protein
MSKKIYRNKGCVKISSWIQLRITNCKFGDDYILGDLSKYLEILRNKKQIKSWFFLNKNDSILLKIESADKYSNKFLDVIKYLKQNGPRINVTTEPFEPEIFQFGGKTGWAVASKYFNSISVLSIKSIKSKITNINAAIVLVFDLLMRNNSDSFEVWDIMQRLMIIRGVSQDYSSAGIEKNTIYQNINTLFNKPDKFYLETFKNTKMIKEVVAASKYCLRELKKNERSLIFSHRKILPYYVIFIFNMLLISESEQKDIIKSMSVLCNPGKY